MKAPVGWSIAGLGGHSNAPAVLLQREERPGYCLWRDGAPGGWLYYNEWAAQAAFHEWAGYWKVAPAAGCWRDFPKEPAAT